MNISSLFFATFSVWKDNKRTGTNGMIDPFIFYFIPKIKNSFILDQPYPGSNKVIPETETYTNGKLKGKFKVLTGQLLSPLLFLSNSPGTHLIFKLRDFLSVIESGLRLNRKIDLFIGLESVNTLAGIILKKIGKVKTVVYYVSDYSPNRFNSKILNSAYLWLDRTCAENVDYIWDVSLAIQPARIKAGLDQKKSATVIHVPNALFRGQLNTIPFEKREKNTIVFVGTLGLENGPDLAVKAFAKVIKKIPSSKLHIIGGGGKGFESEFLKNLAFDLGISRSVVFHGFIPDVKKVSEIIKNFQVAVAPYKFSTEFSVRQYGDATKIRQYLGVGLPIITTNVPPLGKEVKTKKAALIVNDSVEEIARAIIKLLNNKKLNKEMSLNAYNFAKNNTWESTYSRALKKMGLKIEL